jgi:hypothetical protein
MPIHLLESHSGGWVLLVKPDEYPHLHSAASADGAKSVLDVVACRLVKPSGMLRPACMWRDLFSLHHAHKLMMPGLPILSKTPAQKGIHLSSAALLLLLLSP